MISFYSFTFLIYLINSPKIKTVSVSNDVSNSLKDYYWHSKRHRKYKNVPVAIFFYSITNPAISYEQEFIDSGLCYIIYDLIRNLYNSKVDLYFVNSDIKSVGDFWKECNPNTRNKSKANLSMWNIKIEGRLKITIKFYL